MLYGLFLGLIFSATVLVPIALFKNSEGSEKIEGDNGLKIISVRQKQLAQSFTRRIFVPFTRLIGSVSKKVGPTGFVDRIQHRLVLGGSPRNMKADGFLALKFLGLLGAFGIIVSVNMSTNLSFLKLLETGAVIMIGTFFLPDFWLIRKINDRQKAIKLSLPDVLDLLTISVEAGVGFDSALTKVVQNHHGPLAEEFFRMLQEMRLGMTRREALKNLNHRTEVAELSSFILSMLQADIFGISVGKVLRIQAQEMRVKRRQDAEEIAMKAPVKVVFPLVLCIFPALLVVILGPAAINIYQALVRGL